MGCLSSAEAMIKVSPTKLLRLFHQANTDQLSRGLSWFEEANAIASALAKLSGRGTEQAAGIIAALSPASKWERNLEEAQAVLLGTTTTHVTYPGNVKKAYDILAGQDPMQVLGGRKVRAFYQLVMDPTDSYTVCVDRHAVRAVTLRAWTSDKEEAQFLRYGYDRCADAYRTVSKGIGLLPHQLQATVWNVQREMT